MDELDVTQLTEERSSDGEEAQLKAILEAIVYITDEPLSAQQMAAALAQPIDKVKRLLDEIVAEFSKPEHGLSIREVAGGYKMATKAEHHEAVRAFVKKLTPPLKLSLAALETLARVWAQETASTPLRVNLFNPGPIRTRMRAAVFPGEDPMTLDTPEQAAELILPMCLPTWNESGKFFDYPTRKLLRFQSPA